MRQITYHIHRYNEGRSYVQTYTFDYNPGWVALYAKYSDFAVEELPATMTFRISILW